jgi:hypothetical protein
MNSIYNAVLKFRNYITEVAAFIVDTLIEPLPVLYIIPDPDRNVTKGD